jgi:hypothetical protein
VQKTNLGRQRSPNESGWILVAQECVLQTALQWTSGHNVISRKARALYMVGQLQGKWDIVSSTQPPQQIMWHWKKMRKRGKTIEHWNIKKKR